MNNHASFAMRCAFGCAFLFAALSSPVAGQEVIIAFGDSITAGGPQFDEAGEGGYPSRLQRLLRDGGRMATVRNRGVAGDNTLEGLARFDSAISGGDIVLILIGTNDLNRDVSLESSIFNLQEMARRANRAGVEPVLATLIPRSPGAGTDRTNVLTRGLGQLIRDTAFSDNRQLADPFEVFWTTPNLFNEFYTRPGSDPVGHPNSAGFDLLAGVFADVLLGVDSVPPVMGFTIPSDLTPQVPASQDVLVPLYDFGAGLDGPSARLILNGTVVDTGGGSSERARLRYNEPLCGFTRIDVEASDLATPPNTMSRFVTRVEAIGARTIRVDVDQNCRIDGFDIAEFAPSFGTSVGDRRYDPLFDFDKDGDVDGEDLARIAARFGDRVG